VSRAARLWVSFVESVRRRSVSPERLLSGVGLAKGMTLADLGAGYGFYALPAATIVGEGGTVYAVEPDPRRAREIADRAKEMGVRNVRVLVGGAEGIPELGDGSIDLAISVSSFHHFSDRVRALEELRRVVKPGGTIYIRDMKAGRIFRHGSRISEFREVVSKEFPEARFEEGRGYIVTRIGR
jgi:ubiquinone/menaquinone biosynthesis C-methylase UbiE